MQVPVYDMKGQQTGSIEVDAALLGGLVRTDLLKQSVLSWRSNQRQGSSRTKSRGMVEGSTRKLYRQKGTGNARMGSVRSPVRRGGGVTFAKHERSFRKDMPKKMKRLARNSALLAKIQSDNVAVIESIDISEPKTKTLFAVLKAVGADRGCVLALDAPSRAIYRSGRNIPKTEIRQVHELNAYEILRRRKLLLTRKAIETLIAHPDTFQADAGELVAKG